MSGVAVLVNYRSAGLTVSCLRSIHQDGWLPLDGRVVVVDNASGDGSADAVAAAVQRNGWSDWAALVEAPRNGGFAYGNNVGLRVLLGGEAESRNQKAQSGAVGAFQAIGNRESEIGKLSSSPSLRAEGSRGEIRNGDSYVLLLNPDTIVRPGALTVMARFLDEHPAVGIVGPRLLDADGRPQCSAHRFPSPLGELEGTLRVGIVSRLLHRWRVSPPIQDQPHTCDWVSGAAMLIRREVFEQIGLLDEGYFLYFEEVDFCKRAKSAGWDVWYEPAAEIVHLEGASTGIQQARRRRAGYWYDSRRRYFRKHHRMLGLVAADLAWAVGRAGFCVRKALVLARGADNSPKRFAWDLLWGDARSLLFRTHSASA